MNVTQKWQYVTVMHPEEKLDEVMATLQCLEQLHPWSNYAKGQGTNGSFTHYIIYNDAVDAKLAVAWLNEDSNK